MLYPPSASQADNREIKFEEVIKSKKVHFILRRDAQSLPEFKAVTSVAVIPFMDETTIVATQLERGLDIPGGHVEALDKDATATAVREAQEEAGIGLALPLCLVGVIESDYKDVPTYMLVTTTRVAKLNPYTPQLEALGREQVSMDAFLERYTAGSKEMMEELCKRAKAVNHELFSGKR